MPGIKLETFCMQSRCPATEQRTLLNGTRESRMLACGGGGPRSKTCNVTDSICPRVTGSKFTFELQGNSFFQGVRFSVQTTSRGRTAYRRKWWSVTEWGNGEIRNPPPNRYMCGSAEVCIMLIAPWMKAESAKLVENSWAAPFIHWHKRKGAVSDHQI